MIDSKTSSDAEMLARFNRIFVDANQSNDYGIHFVDVNGKNVVRKHSWANILETQVVSNVFKSSSFIDTWHMPLQEYHNLQNKLDFFPLFRID